MLFEERLIYFPEPYPHGFREVATLMASDPGAPEIEDAFLTASDGVQLHAWHCSPREPALPARPVLLFFHGNAGNLAWRYDLLRELVRLPAEVFILDYRGYGRSQGTPSEEGLYRDAQAAWDHLVGPRGVDPARIVVFGKSLGGAVAVDLAVRVRPAGLVIQSSFTSVPDMAGTLLPFVPRALIRTRMDSLAKIGAVRCPKLFVHSPADEVVPFRLGRRLFEAASEPKRFLEVPHARHNETHLVGGRGYFASLRDFLETCVGTERP